MNSDITFCAYEECTNTDCMRFYLNAPRNRSRSWFGVTQKEDGSCVACSDYYCKNCKLFHLVTS